MKGYGSHRRPSSAKGGSGRSHPLRDGPRPLSLLRTLIVVVAAFGAVLLFAACRGQVAKTDAPRFVYSHFEGASTSLYIAAADNPNAGTLLARLEHAEGYSGKAALSPDGLTLALTNLPLGTRETEGKAYLYTLPAAGGEPKLLYRGIDLAARPVWSPHGNSILVRSTERRGDTATIRLLAVDSRRGTATTLVSDSEAFGLYPIGWAANAGAAYYARVGAGGTSLLAAAPTGGGARDLAHLSDGIARDFALSPDASRIAFVAPAKPGTELASVDVTTGERVVHLRSPDTLLAPQWQASGGLTFGIGGDQPAAVGKISAAGVQALAAAPPLSGYDAPLAFAPGGDYLAAIHYQGTGSTVTSAETVILSTQQRSRRALGKAGVYTFIAWLP